MNTKIVIIIAVLVIVAVGAFFVVSQSGKMQQQGSMSQTQPAAESGSSPAAVKGVVVIQNMAFSPSTLTIKVGDKVTWTNQDSVGHSATADDNSFDTGVLAQGQSGSVTFSKAGTYTYHCKVHTFMTGTIRDWNLSLT